MGNFPQNEQEALAMLYVQSRDISSLSPEDVYDLYRDAYKRIHSRRTESPTPANASELPHF